MNILAVDVRGGGLDCQLTEQIKRLYPKAEITAVGTKADLMESHD